MKNKGVAITGMGIISAIGHNLAENYQALIEGKHGISTIANIATRHKNSIKVGEIKDTNEALIQELQLAPTNNYSRTALLGAIAAKEAIANAAITDIDAHRTGLISATSVGSMDKTEQYYYSCFDNPSHRKYIQTHHAGDSTQKIAQQIGIRAYATTISTACSSAANAIMLGARMIKAGKLDRVVVGGTDCLSKFTINGFKTLMILSDKHCRPFDADRKGLNLGEGAAFLVLESEAILQQNPKKVLAYVSGYGNANDAFHQTASSDNGEGATLAMQAALKVAALDAKEIDYINAHGTATSNNDLSEGIAIKNIFGSQLPPISSTKAFTGHTLAAAGALEAVFSVLALQQQVVFPNLNFQNPIPEHGIIPETQLQKSKLTHILSNSFGFGGNCSTLILSKHML